MPSTPDETGPDVISDEELQKLSIGELKLHNAPITLVEYDLSWPRLFAREADRIRVVLGDTALRIEHVGSTSVPGLAAKPIIDILLVVANSVDESSYVPNLEAAGYVLRIREPEWFEHRLFKGPDTNINLHVFSVGAAEIDRMLRFRDWLRATNADRDYYARVKRDLAQRTWRHVQHYADAKTAVVQEITERATPRQRAVTGRDHSDQPMTENVMVRAARREDLSAVRELERAAGAAFRDLDMAAVADDEPPTITELLAFQNDGRAWVITDDADRPVAYLLLDVVDGNAHVEQVSVHPDHARQGLGKTLLDTAAAWAQQHGLAALTLTTYANVAWNAPYYERLGFRIMAEDQITDGLRRIREHEQARGLATWPRVTMRRPVGS